MAVFMGDSLSDGSGTGTELRGRSFPGQPPPATSRRSVLKLTAATEQILGIEILEVEAGKARRRLVSPLWTRRAGKMVETGDFFAWWKRTKQPSFDAVIGNPPFIRYQSFPEPHRQPGDENHEGSWSRAEPAHEHLGTLRHGRSPLASEMEVDSHWCFLPNCYR